MKTILISGATSGFGLFMTEKYLAYGDRVIATGRKLRSRSEIFADLRTRYPNRLLEKDLDVTSESDLNALVSDLQTEKLTIDVLINNAGHGLFGSLEDSSAKQIQDQLDVNFIGLVMVTKKLLPFLRETRGQIINFSSFLGMTGFPLMSLYCASKYAVEGFSEALSHELRPHGVQVSVIEPGAYRTNFGANVQWASDSERTDSPYYKQSTNYRRFFAEMRSKPSKNDPQELAASIVRLTHSKSRLPLRLQFGSDCKSTFWMRRLLPEFIFLKMIGGFFKRIFDREILN